MAVRAPQRGRLEDAFHGTYREVTPPERIVQTFEWEGMPGHVLVETATLEDLEGRTRVRTVSLFHTRERDGMLESGMEEGMSESHARFDELMERLGSGDGHPFPLRHAQRMSARAWAAFGLGDPVSVHQGGR